MIRSAKNILRIENSRLWKFPVTPRTVEVYYKNSVAPADHFSALEVALGLKKVGDPWCTVTGWIKKVVRESTYTKPSRVICINIYFVNFR